MPAYKNTKRGTWYASFYYKDSNGNSQRKKKEGFSTKREALEWERNYIDLHSNNSELTFGALFDVYINDCQTRLRNTTIKNKKWIAEYYLLPKFAKVKISDITPVMIRKWQNELLTTENNGKKHSPKYLKRINNEFSSAMNYAVKFYGLKQNPVSLAGTLGKGKSDEMHFWTLSEFNKAMANVRSQRTRLMLEVLFWTGMRVGELLALTLNDVNVTKGTISITKTAAWLNGKTVINPPKTAKSNRVITVPQFIIDKIAEYVDRLYDYEPGDRLFTVSNSSLKSALDRAGSRAGLQHIRVHDLRHSHASMLIEMGYSPLMVAERLGHENINTTLQTYSHLYPNKQQEIAQKLQEVASESKCVSLSDNELE